MPTFRVCHPHGTLCQQCPLELCHEQCVVGNMADLSRGRSILGRARGQGEQGCQRENGGSGISRLLSLAMWEGQLAIQGIFRQPHCLWLLIPHILKVVGLCLSYLGLIDSEVHEGEIKLMCLCLHVVFQFSSFLLNLEMKAAIRTDTL